MMYISYYSIDAEPSNIMEKQFLYYGLSPKLSQEILDLIAKSLAEVNSSVLASKFLQPSEIFAFIDAVNSLPTRREFKYKFYGGYKDAEYKRLIIGPTSSLIDEYSYGEVWLYQGTKSFPSHVP